MQYIFDELYSKSCNNRKFKDLMMIISNENNILLAYRNIKNNDGSQTKGTDGKTIADYKEWNEEQFVKYFQGKLQNYIPKSVRRVEIPKPNGKTRPLGIPCMDDRIIQQCMKQVLEPICEAKFHKHSYGFRPNRSTQHAIARASFLMWNSQLHYVVDVDIKGFFDNVNHGKLLKQMWTLGIQDKKLLCVIGKLLKSEIQGQGIPTKGVPQGGIISPLLSNIVLNELDWWISNQWETMQTTKCQYTFRNKYRALRGSKLKEMFLARYADDFKIFCRDYETAQKVFVAVRQWLSERLGLEISPEKSKITNVRKGKTEFLGFRLFMKPKRKKYICKSSISEKAKTAIKKNLKQQIKEIQKSPTSHEVNKLNSMILGIHNYYKISTQVADNFREINFAVSQSFENRLKIHLKKSNIEAMKSKTYVKLYGKYNGKVKAVVGIAIFPIYGCKFCKPKGFTQEINNYTVIGRSLIHDRVSIAYLIQYLLTSKEYEKSTEYNDNRISLIAGQQGKCAVTGCSLVIGEMECHHKKPKSLGGTDEYKNLIWVHSDVHKLIHATTVETIQKYCKLLKPDEVAMKKVNSLRLLAENLEIVNIM
nr:group II intron reverse transcriptase/maturase [Clostridium felsineum]